MALQTVTFDEPGYAPALGVKFCSQSVGGPNTLGDGAGTGLTVIIAIGSMELLQSGSGNRFIFFTRFQNGNGDCPQQSVARLVLRFAAPQRYVRFRISSDFVGAGDAPVLVNYYADISATNLVHQQPFDFGDSPWIEYSDAGQAVREIVITSAGAENTVDDLEFSDTVPSAQRDVAAVFDGSGSMAAQGKWPAMIESADIFHDLYAALGDGADTFGGVLFRSDCSTTVGGLQLQDRPAAGPLSTTVDVPALFAADAPGGCTPIGEGLVTAGTMVQAGGNPAKALLLLTDGINNRGRSVAQASADPSLQGVSVHAVGLGDGLQIDPVEIASVAADHGGFFRQTTDPSEVTDFFAQALGQLLGKAEMAVVTGDTAVVASGTTKAVFLIAWPVGGSAVDFSLVAPDGTVFSASSPSGGGPASSVSYHPAGASSFHAYYVVEGADLGGTWTFQGAPAAASRMVVEDLSIQVRWSIAPALGFAGEPIVLRARITRDGKPFDGAARVRGRVVAPTVAAGELLARGGTLLKRRSRSTVDPNLRRAVAAKGLAAGKLKELPTEESPVRFRRKGVGVYEMVFRATDVDGVYRFDLDAESREPGTVFHRRVTLFAVLVSAPDAGSTPVRVTPLGPGLMQVTVTPRASRNRRVGPFLSPYLRLRTNQGEFSGGITDYLDGSYGQVLAWKGRGLPGVTVELLGRSFQAGPTKRARKSEPAAKPRSDAKAKGKKKGKGR